MKRRKFLNIEIDGQENIGVIDLGEIDSQSTEEMQVEKIEISIQEKLPIALKAHYDNEIEIMQAVVVRLIGSIKVNAKVRILDCEDEEECSIEEVTLTETWIY